jgi:predicted DsbA family dithiol-disulfide isomerase
MESPRVVADVVEVQEFPHLAQAYQVRAVPKTVINDTFEFTGAATEEQLVTRALKAVGIEGLEEDPAEVDGETTPVA